MSPRSVSLAIFLLIHLFSEAQQRRRDASLLPVNPQDLVPPVITMRNTGNNQVLFQASLRPLRQVAGAPAAFYSYFWEFGDGAFSEDEKPEHRYAQPGTYLVRLYATNNHDDGTAPPVKPQSFYVNVKDPLPGNREIIFFDKNDQNIKVKVNRNPKPGEDLVATIGYRNRLFENLGGSLLLFFNERDFNNEGFALADKRTYNGEQDAAINDVYAQLDNSLSELSSALAGPNATQYSYLEDTRTMLRDLQVNYMKHVVYRFEKLPKGKENYLFMTLNTLPEMIQDTNAVVTMTAMLVPDNPFLQPEQFQLEMQIVASHDPNRMVIKPRRINYRFMRKTKQLTYKVNFQNTGKGPTRNISIGIAMPRQLNTSSIQVKSQNPSCVFCSTAYRGQSCIDTLRTADSLYVLFNNIYLPGLRQEHVRNKDSTRGFVEYTIKFKKRPKKKPFDSRAVIVFDKNEPVYTNRAVARFTRGVSPGIMAGYNMAFSNGDYTAKGPLQIGYTLAPYAPAKPYFQLEFHGGFMQQEKLAGGFEKIQKDTSIRGTKYNIDGMQTVTIKQRNLLQIVPLHFRHNINKWIAVGAGVMGQITINEQTKTERNYSAFRIYDFNSTGRIDTTFKGNTSKNTIEARSWKDANIAAFGDIQAGMVKNGPALGLRYYRQMRGNIRNQFFLYASFKL